jgi:predicted dehydrogenase
MPNIAVLSTAHIHTKSFLENLAKGADGRRAYAIWDDVPDRGRRYASQYGAKFEPRLGKLLRDKAVDGFLICAENTRHWPLLRKALPAGRPVMCEKPLCTTVREARKVADLLRKHPARLFCGYYLPFTEPMQAVRKMLGEKALGAVTRARFRNAHHAAYGHWFDNADLQWFYNPVLAGGGAMMDMGTHAVHLLRTLFGPVREVWATISNQSGIYAAVDDFGVAHLRFPTGILGTVEAAWRSPGRKKRSGTTARSMSPAPRARSLPPWPRFPPGPWPSTASSLPSSARSATRNSPRTSPPSWTPWPSWRPPTSPAAPASGSRSSNCATSPWTRRRPSPNPRRAQTKVRGERLEVREPPVNALSFGLPRTVTFGSRR